MNSNKLNILNQDLKEVKGAIDDLDEVLDSRIELEFMKDLRDKFEILKEHLKDHMETIDNFICDMK